MMLGTSVDLNEEFSAFSGQLLLDQAEYLNDAVRYILSLYPRSESVLIVGHSMGGVVARLMFTLPNYKPGSVTNILTLASPHAMAPIVLDPKLYLAYTTMNRYWKNGYEGHNAPLTNVSLISIAGGTPDSIINSDAASITGLFPRSQSLSVFTTSIPGVWTGCDHMAILWCNQLVKAVAAALVETVDVKHPTKSKPLTERMQVYESHFLSLPPQVTRRGMCFARSQRRERCD